MRAWGTLAGLAVGLALAACGAGAARAPAGSPGAGSGTRSGTRSRTAAPCALPSLPAAASVGGPAARSLRGGPARAAFSLDGGDLRVLPPAPGQRPQVSAARAECTALAALNSDNAPLVAAALRSGIALGYGRVTVAPRLLAAAQPPPAYPAPATLPAPAPYQARLAWVLVVGEHFVTSCPAMAAPSPGPAAPLPSDHGYGVFLLDARTGVDALLYVEGRPAPCGRPGRVGPAVTVPVEQVSVPWTLAARNPNGYAATIRATLPACDAYPGTVLVARDRPLVRVVATRPVGGDCGAARQVTLALHAATVTSDLPAHLGHAPVGLYIAVPAARPAPAPAPGRAAGVLRILGPSDAGRTITIGVGSVLVVSPWAGLDPRGPNPAVSSDGAVLGPLSAAGRGPVAEFRAWKAGSADLTIPAAACAQPFSRVPPCTGPWVVHVDVTRRNAGAG